MDNIHCCYDPAELLQIVAKLSEKYTAKESTSIPYEVAQQLMNAVLYCMRETENAAEKDMFSLRNMKDTYSAQKAYETGYQLVIEKFLAAQTLYGTIMEQFLDYGNLAYHDTVVDGMKHFFAAYDYNFCPQEHLLTLDYPILTPLTSKLCGVDRIYEYLKAIELEQRFLNRLPKTYILEILAGYGEYETFIWNLPTVLMKRLLASFLLGRHPQSFLKQNDLILLSKKVSALLETGKLLAIMKEGMDCLIRQGYGEDTVLCDYLKQAVPDICAEFKNGVKWNSLAQVLGL